MILATIKDRMLGYIVRLLTRLSTRVVLFGILYLLTAQLSREASLPEASSPTLWLPSGLFVAVLLISPVHRWPAYILAGVTANIADHLLASTSLLNSFLFTLINLFEAVASAWAICRFHPNPRRFAKPEDVLRLITIASLLATGLSAILHTSVLALQRPEINFWALIQIVWTSHTLGSLAVAPLPLSWFGGYAKPKRKTEPERLIELSLLIAGLFTSSLYVFVSEFGLNRHSYVIVPFLVWAALRFGLRGVTFNGLVVVVLSTWGTAQRLHNLAIDDPSIALGMGALGQFLSITLVTCYILAATWEQSRRVEQALRESEARYRLLVENQGEGVSIVDKDEVFVFANPAAAQILGVNPGSLAGRSLREFCDPRQFEIIKQQTQLRIKGEKTSYEVEVRQPGGKQRTLLINASPQYNQEGEFKGAFAVFVDITDRKEAEKALRESQVRFQTLFDHTPIPIWEEDFSRIKRFIDEIGQMESEVVAAACDSATDAGARSEDWRDFFYKHPEYVDVCEAMVRILDVNQAAMDFYGFTDKAAFLAKVNQELRRGPRDVFIEELIAIAEGKLEFEMEGANDLIDGVIRYHLVRWTVAPGCEQDYRRVIVTITDVTDRRKSEEQLRFLSTHDVLTGLYNRNFFEAEVERLQNSRLEPVNVMMIDVNGMKAINDTLGHAAGDELLRRTAQVLKLSFRKEDVIARIGGDEFVVLFTGSVPIKQAVARVNECLNEHNLWYEGQPLSLAIGAVSGGKGSLLADLLRQADQLMYKEKMRASRTRV